MRPRPIGRACVALLAAGLITAACTSDGPSDETSPRENRGGGPIAFETAGGDSYSWTEKLIGRAECENVTVDVNGEPVDAPVELNGTSFIVDIPLHPGDNEVVAGCDVGGERVISEPVTFTQRLQQRPTARIDVSVEGGTVIMDGGSSAATEPDGSEVVDYRWTPGPRPQRAMRAPGGEEFEQERGRRLRLEVPAADGEYFVTLEVTDGEGRSDKSTAYFVVEEGRARAVDVMHEHPAWIDSAVIYAPIPQLWGNGGPKAVQRELPYLKKLGVDALWLWPPTSLRAAGEEYAITDYFEVDPSWGPESALKEMIDEAHKLGLYVLVDFVPNHMSSESPYFKDAEARGHLSPYWDFFDRKGGEPTHYFDWDHLPNLNYKNPEVRTMIMEAMAHWVRDIGVDGFRVDVAWGVKRRRPSFWPDWRREMKRINPDLLLLAEASAVDPYYFSHGFDIAYDWTTELGDWAWGSAFEFPQEAGALLSSAITNGGKGYSKDALILRFLNNNDTGVRFVDQHGPEVTRVAATLQFTLPGVLAMFAGDEIGASYEPYSNLTPIPWRDKHDLRPLYQRLIELKHGTPALNSRDVDVLTVDTGSALAFVRPAVAGGDPILVVLNFGSKARVEIEGSPALAAAIAGSSGSMRDLVSGKSVHLEVRPGSATVAMPGTSSLVLIPEGE